MERAVAYLSVSTQRQQRSGLGLDAQRAAINHLAARDSLTVAAEFVEAETGKGADALDRRPQDMRPGPSLFQHGSVPRSN
jgi:DNA invertase Pin-like site-specific DNA recombinase